MGKTGKNTEDIKGENITLKRVTQIKCQENYSSVCGEETSPTPQTDWSLAHELKAAFGSNLLPRNTV